MMKRMEWKDFTSGQRRALKAGAAVQLLLLAAALLDLSRRSSEELRGGKRLWVPAVFVNFVGPITYFLLGRKR